MTGAEALAFVRRRLAEQGLTVEADREAELLDYITQGRDLLLQTFAASAPVVVRTTLTLAQDDDDDTLWSFPEDVNDPYRTLEVLEATTREPLTPAAQLGFDDGHYEWETIRQIRTVEGVDFDGGIIVRTVLAGDPIDVDTPSTHAAWGIPTTTHRAACLMAAVLALTADEESDATLATGLLQREVTSLEKLYASYDDNAGQAFGVALLAAVGQKFGDTIY